MIFNKMYYINNNIYITNIRDLVGVVNNMMINKFNKRPLIYVTDNEDIILTDELENELNYYNLKITLVPTDTDIFSLGKCIVIYDDDRAESIPYYYYNSLFRQLKVSTELFNKYITKFGITPKKIVNKTYTIDISTSKGVPFDVLIFLLINNTLSTQASKLLYEKLLISIEKIKQEQINTYLSLETHLMIHLCSNIPAFASIVEPMYGRAVTSSDFDAFVDILTQEEDIIKTLVNSEELEDLLDNKDVNQFCKDIATNSGWKLSLKNIMSKKSLYYFKKRNKRLNYIRV